MMQPHRSARNASVLMQNCVFFCQDVSAQDLSSFSTWNAEVKIRAIVKEIADEALNTRLSGVEDLVAMEAKYHKACITKIHNRLWSMRQKQQPSSNEEECIITSRVFSELVEYIDHEIRLGKQSFKLVTIRDLYEKRLAEFGINRHVHNTRLKEKIIDYFLDCTAHYDGSNVVFMFDETLRLLLHETHRETVDQEALALLKAAKILRRDILGHEGFRFDGHFRRGCQKESMPS